MFWKKCDSLRLWDECDTKHVRLSNSINLQQLQDEQTFITSILWMEHPHTPQSERLGMYLQKA